MFRAGMHTLRGGVRTRGGVLTAGAVVALVLSGVTMSVPRTLANRRRLTTVDGLSSAKSRTSSSTSISDLSTREPGRLVLIESSENQAGSVELAP